MVNCFHIYRPQSTKQSTPNSNASDLYWDVSGKGWSIGLNYAGSVWCAKACKILQRLPTGNWQKLTLNISNCASKNKLGNEVKVAPVHTTNAYGAKEVQLHSLISASDGMNGRFIAPGPSCFTSSERVPDTHTKKWGWVDPRADLAVLPHASNHTAIPQVSTPYSVHLYQLLTKTKQLSRALKASFYNVVLLSLTTWYIPSGKKMSVPSSCILLHKVKG